jgi:hypothetical protein
MTECLFNTTVPLTVRSNSGVGGGGYFPATFGAAYNPAFYTTNVTPVQLMDESGKRVNSVIFEIYLQSIVANKKVNGRARSILLMGVFLYFWTHWRGHFQNGSIFPRHPLPFCRLRFRCCNCGFRT